MPLTVTCTHCKKRVTLPDGAAGKTYRCPNCKQALSPSSSAAPSRAVSPSRTTASGGSSLMVRIGLACMAFGALGLILPMFGLQLRKLNNTAPGSQTAVATGVLILGGVIAGLGALPSATGRKVRRFVLWGGLSLVALFILAALLAPVLARSRSAAPQSAAQPSTAFPTAPPSASPAPFTPGAAPSAGTMPPAGNMPPVGNMPPIQMPPRPPAMKSDDPGVVTVIVHDANASTYDSIRKRLLAARPSPFIGWQGSNRDSNGQVVFRVKSTDLAAVRDWFDEFGIFDRVEGRTIHLRAATGESIAPADAPPPGRSPGDASTTRPKP